MSKEPEILLRNQQKEVLDEKATPGVGQVFGRLLNLLNRGKIDHPDGHACLTGKCGDTMEIFLRFENDKVKEASFQTDGCISSAICGSFAAEMAMGKGPDELLEITGESILKKAGDLTREHEHCAFLAGEALQEALNDYMIRETGKKKLEH